MYYMEKKGQISGIYYNNNENTHKQKKPTRVFHGFGISHYYIQDQDTRVTK